ncbi:MAG: cob(I)yrinic acid a,c-diamide adenosyltransferase [Porphyromonadaceae bacterium]|nr:cob(I)yrinic acid a,c-diamide adenosyltransferase [Porphyromonadaceae bacterium]
MKKSTLYTGTGDQGTTSLVGGKRVPKQDLRIETYGTIDELNAHLGLLSALLSPKAASAAPLLLDIQHRLFSIGSYLATDTEGTALQATTPVHPEEVKRLEEGIDRLDAALPPLCNFVLPGGATASAQAHVCRTVCRRAERHICKLHTHHPVDPLLLQYINRLSDYLFVLSRWVNFVEGRDEIYWDKGCK